MSQIERADDLAVRALWFLGDHWLGHPAHTEEDLAELRTAAFLFSEMKPNGDPLVSKARGIADAVLELLSPLRAPDSEAKLKDASDAYQQARLLQ